MDITNDTPGLSLGCFRHEISGMKTLYLTRNGPLEPLSISMPIDSVRVVLGAAPCVLLRYGEAHITLSHISAVKRSIKDGVKGYKIVCGDYTASNVPVLVEYRLCVK